MVDIEKIIGKQAFERLKKASKGSEDAIKRMGPSELMSVAGLGPVKAGRLLRKLGVSIAQKDVDRAYTRLKNKTRYAGAKRFLKSLKNNPRDRISRIESRRNELIAWQNLLATTRNIGRGKVVDGQYIRSREGETYYAPVSTALDPFSVEIGQTTGDMIYGEVFVVPEEGRVRVHFEVRNLDDGEMLLSENDFVDNQNTVQMVTRIGDVIEQMYDNFRKRTTVGLFFVVLDKDLEQAGFYDSLRERFRTLIGQEKMILKANQEEYYDWEALFKYQSNKTFESLVVRLDRYHLYMLYDQYLTEGGNESFDDWKADRSNFSNDTFWSYMEDANRSKQHSHQRLTYDGAKVLFGILKGIPGAMNFDTEWRVINANLPDYRDTGFETYKALKTELPVDVGGVSVPAVIIALVNSVLVRARIFKDPVSDRIIFRSEEIPEVGVLYER